MPFWKDPGYLKLKEQTQDEPLWRRVVATISGFVIVMFGLVVGILAGTFFVAKSLGDISNFSEIWNLNANSLYMIGAIVLALLLGLFSFRIWIWLMIKTNFVSAEMLERIYKYGPY